MTTRALFVFLLLGTPALLLNESPTYCSAKDPYVDSMTGLEFRDIEGLERLDTHFFEGRGLGYSVDYVSPRSTRVSIYVYDFELPNITDGPFSPLVKGQFDSAKQDIFRAMEQGHYQAAEELSNEIVLLGESDDAPKMRKSTFKLRRNDKDWISYIYVTGHKKHFVKVRCTLPADDQAACEKESAQVFARLTEMLTAADD